MNSTFQNILDLKKAYYPLIDSGLVKDDDLNFIIEELVTRSGYDLDQFNTWMAN